MVDFGGYFHDFPRIFLGFQVSTMDTERCRCSRKELLQCPKSRNHIQHGFNTKPYKTKGFSTPAVQHNRVPDQKLESGTNSSDDEHAGSWNQSPFLTQNVKFLTKNRLGEALFSCFSHRCAARNFSPFAFFVGKTLLFARFRDGKNFATKNQYKSISFLVWIIKRCNNCIGKFSEVKFLFWN